MKKLHKQFVNTCILVLLILVIFYSIPVNASMGDEASLAVAEAESVLKQAFEAILEAEEARGNVSDLVIRLNEAGWLLAKAENAFRVGNFNEAIDKAEECFQVADGVLADALSLKMEALAEAEAAFWGKLHFSVAGSIVFIVVLFFVWRWFRRFYARGLLRMRPEVASDVED
jgi:hypothetical protein